PKPMGWHDVSSWKYISTPTVTISPDGKWTAYAMVTVEGDGEVFLKNLTTDSVKKYAIGGSPMPSMQFSKDGKWFAFKEYPKYKEAKAASKNPGKQLFQTLHLIDLSADLKKTDFDHAGTFSFNGDASTYLAVSIAKERSPGAKPGDSNAGDLLLYELSTGKKINVGNVGEYEFNKKGNTLAYTVDAANNAGNGLYSLNLNDKKISVYDNDSTSYKSLGWTEDKDAFAVLKMSKDKDFKTDKGVVLGVKNISGTPIVYTYEPQKDSLHFPKHMTISGNRQPYWSDDMSRIFFGINTLEAVKDEMEQDKKDTAKTPAVPDIEKIKSDTSIKSIADLKKALAKLEPAKPKMDNKKDIDKPDMVIWNWQDSRLQSNQQVTERADKVFSFLAMYDVNSKKYTRLNDSSMMSVNVMPKELYAIGMSDSAYQLETNLDGQRYADIYIVNLVTGEKSPFKNKLYVPSYSAMPNAAPDGKKFVYGNDGNFYVYDIVNKKEQNITANVPTSFVDTEDDHNVTKPLTRIIGWSSDSKYVLINDLWDIWQINADGSGKAINLTQNGKQNKNRYQVRFNLYPDDKGIDLKKPQYFNVYGEWTKKSGIAMLEPGKNGLNPGAKMLVWDDFVFSNLSKTTLANVYSYSKEDNNKAPE
ncbi:MAG: hypothetical protein ABIP35_17740, partial [Ginsengibacter sp.]